MTITWILASVIVTITPLGWDLGNWDICWGDIWGIYMEWKVYVCASNDSDFELFHEYGHHIYSLLTQEQKDEYTRAYKLAKIRWINAFLRDYSLSDVEESFCDDFSSWQTKEQVNIYIKKRIKLIQKLIRQR